MAAIIMCLVVRVEDGATLICSDHTRIRVAGLATETSALKKGRDILSMLTVGKKISCLPAGNEGPFIVAKCTLPDRRDLACTLIKLHAGVRSEAAWRRYGLENCK